MNTSPLLRAVLLGDSMSANHHGCHQLMSNWLRGLANVGIEPLARHIGPTWRQSPAIVQALQEADLLVINAEGGIHHNRYIGDRMLEAAEFAHQHGVPAYLMNCTWQANTPELARRAAVFRRIYVRESPSQQELAAAGTPSTVVPDLTFATPFEITEHARHGWLVSDSAMTDVTEQLYRLSRQVDGLRFAPVISSSWRRNPRRQKRYAQWLLAKTLGQLRLCPARYMSLTVALPDPLAYLNQLAGAEAVLAGRFHTVCFALITQTPFVAIPANTRKIEGLLQDAGLPSTRLLRAELTPATVTQTLTAASFTPAELASITGYVRRARELIAAMFAETARDAREAKGKA